MKHPKGKLVAVGGAINYQGQEEHNLTHYDESILEHIVHLASGKQKPHFEIITSASAIPDEAAKDYITCLKKLGCKTANHLKITKREDAYDKQFMERIKKCNGVVFTGGDQSRLCTVLGGSPVMSCIKKMYESKPFIVAGVSAGAAAMGDMIISAGNAGEGYHKGAIILTMGLGFIKDVIIDTHFDKRGRFGRLSQAVITQPGVLGIGLGENTGVILSKGFHIEAIGTSSAVVIDGSNLKYSNIADIEDGKALSSEGLQVHFMANGDKYDISNKVFIRPADLKNPLL